MHRLPTYACTTGIGWALESEFRQAVELDPGYAIAHYWYAEYLMAMGRTREAVGQSGNTARSWIH